MENSKDFPISHYMQYLELHCRSYGDQRNSFHLRVGWAIKRISSNIFLENKKKCAMLDRSIHIKEALFHTIPFSEVKDMKSNISWALKASLFKKNFEPYL